MLIKRFFYGFFSLVFLASCSGPAPTGLPTASVETPYGITQFPGSSSTPSYTNTPPSEVHIQNGDLALFNGDYSLAQTEYQEALTTTTDPSIEAAAIWGLGRVNLQAGNLGTALNNLNQLIVDFPDSPHVAHAHFLRGKILMELERYPESVEAYTSYLLHKPSVIDYYVFKRRGDAYFSMGDYLNAIADYRSALNSAHIGDDTSLQIKLALAYESAGDSITAFGMYDAIATNTDDYQVKAQMDLFAGRLYLALGRSQEAYDRFLHTVENYPLEYESYSALVALVEAGVPVDDYYRGLVDYYAGQYGFALDAFNRYAEAYPENDGTVQYYRALALRDLGLYQEAVDAYTFFISNYQSNYYWKAACEDKADIQWFRLGQYEAAAETLKEFIRLSSDVSAIPQALLDIGRIYERANFLAQAAETWESIADIYPGSSLVSQALFWAGIVRYRAGEYEKALLAFQRGTLFAYTTEEQARTLFWSGKTQQMLGDTAGAQASFLQAASIDPTDYYSLRAQDILFARSPFGLPAVSTYTFDMTAERTMADSWLRVTFNLPTETDLSGLGWLSSDARLVQGMELWTLDLPMEATAEFEDLRNAVSENAEDSYRLGNYLLGLGLYTPAIFALRQVLTLAGMVEQFETLAAPRYFNLARYGLYYQDIILQYARSDGYDPLFLFAVMRQESLFNSLAGSGQGALGLMQITPDTAQYLVDYYNWPPDFKSEDLYRPQVSIGLGTSYLSDLRLRYSGELYTALAAYNAGPNAAPIWRDLSGPDPDLFLETIRYPETHDYIIGIYEIYNMYHGLYETAP